ncbi:MAG: phosphatidylcholine/phosphatidylserine synthase [Phycisphaerae bacterium]|nr:phosphatidylcholine/phosphatidylserine synthase [Phycisphaerae bacterium]
MTPTKDNTPSDRSTKAQRREKRAERRRQRIVASISVLPSLLTLSNGLLGFAAIAVATRQETAFPTALSNQALAIWLLVGAMLCDMLDGRVARMTHVTSDFGGQLDSMCDVISFGLAPAIIMLRTTVLTMHEALGAQAQGHRMFERAIWCCAATYVACAVVRLARFNVENEPDESAHMDFKGLPSPGAAAGLLSLILLFEHLRNKSGGGWLANSLLKADWFDGPWLLSVICILLPIVTVLIGLLMVSQFPYVHLLNQYVRGKKPVGYLVKMILMVLLIVIMPLVTLTVATQVFVFSAPIKAILAKARRSGGENQDTPDPVPDDKPVS